MSYKTILPYVGGKQMVVKRLARYFPLNMPALGSPFIGGGSVEVRMAAQGLQVTAADACWELATFWRVLLDDPVALESRLRSMMPIQYPLDPYREALREPPDDPVDVACLFYILIVCGFSHIIRGTGGSPITTQDLNKNPEGLLERVRRFSCPNLSVEHLDCFAFLAKYPDLPLYCDPPYANGSQGLYGFSEDLHSGFPHEVWRDALMAHGAPWVQSYGDCEFIRELYAGCVFDEEQWKYGSTNAGDNDVRNGYELVIRPPGSLPVTSLDRLRVQARKDAVTAHRRERERMSRLLW